MLSHRGLFTTATTIMAIEFDGGVVLGADSRTSASGLVVNRAADKLSPLTDKIYCCRSGAAGDTQAITHIVACNLQYYGSPGPGRPVEVYTAACEFRNCCYKNRQNSLAGIIVAGWDDRKGGQVYSIPLGGMLTRLPYAISGSGAPYVKGYVENNYKEGMTLKQCIELVKTAIWTGIRFDCSSGGVVRIGVIDKDGIKRHIYTDRDEPEVSSSQSLSSLIAGEEEASNCEKSSK